MVTPIISAFLSPSLTNKHLMFVASHIDMIKHICVIYIISYGEISHIEPVLSLLPERQSIEDNRKRKTRTDVQESKERGFYILIILNANRASIYAQCI